MTYLEKVKARIEAATDGPWVKFDADGVFALLPAGRPGSIAEVMTEDNAEFFRSAREDMPRLVEMVERLQKSLKPLAAQVCYCDPPHYQGKCESCEARAMLAELEKE